MSAISDRFDSIGLLQAVRRPATRLVAATALVFYCMYHITRFEPARLELLVPNVDTSILFSFARQIYHRGGYLAHLKTGNFTQVFPYPPSAVLMFNLLGAGGERVFIALWTLLMVCGLVVTMRASVAAENDEIQSVWLAIGLFSLVFSDSPVSWDLRSGNSNLVCLGLVLAAYGLLARRPAIAGALVALSVSLKLYSALLIVWLLIKGPKKALYAAAITLLVLWLLLPWALFATPGAIKLYSGWSEQLRIVSGFRIYPETAAHGYGPPLVTLRRAAASLTAAGADAAVTRALLAGCWAIWTGALLWYGARAMRYPDLRPLPSRAALADWTVLMLAPLPFSPWLEPYHAVSVLPGTILCLAVALDWREGSRERAAAAAALLALLVIHVVHVPFDIRGLGVLAQFLILVVVLGVLRPSLARIADRMGLRACAPLDKKIGSAGA
jgi:hypothetical protein